MNITVERAPGNRIGREVVNVLLVDRNAAKARGIALINHNDSSRKTLTGNGPKNFFMSPTRLVEIIKKRSRFKGILTMYSRSYDKDGNFYTINSSMAIEVQIPDTRPEEI